MAQQNNKREFPETLVTPKGIASWAYVHAPDTKYNEEGVYHLKLSLTPDEAAPFIEKIEKVVAESLVAWQEANPKKKPKMDGDRYQTDDETGRVVFHFKRNVKKRDGSMLKPPVIFDSQGKPLVGTKIGNGSIIKVAFQIFPHQNYSPTIGIGVKLGLDSVQVVQLKEFSSGGGAARRFGVEEDGYVAETNASPFAADASAGPSTVVIQSGSDF